MHSNREDSWSSHHVAAQKQNKDKKVGLMAPCSTGKMKSIICLVSKPMNNHCSWQNISWRRECLCNNDREDKEYTKTNWFGALLALLVLARRRKRSIWELASAYLPEKPVLKNQGWINSRMHLCKRIQGHIFIFLIFLLSGKFLGWISLWNGSITGGGESVSCEGQDNHKLNRRF